jgi:intergrase/recombinase
VEKRGGACVKFKYLRVVDKKPKKKMHIRKAIESVSREMVEEFDNSRLEYALLQVPEGKTVEGVARSIDKVIKKMKLTNVEVYVTTDDEVALYRK